MLHFGVLVLHFSVSVFRCLVMFQGKSEFSFLVFKLKPIQKYMKDIMHRQMGTRKNLSPGWGLNPRPMCLNVTAQMQLRVIYGIENFDSVTV